jgi:Ca-activated chloride channel family protein
MKSTLAVNSGAVLVAVLIIAGATPQRPWPFVAAPRSVTGGALLIRNPDRGLTQECPLKHTDVKAEITGFIARATVTQEFENKATDTIEAVYVFPLPHNGAVDDMTIQVGDRTIKGTIKKRDEARAIYDAARAAGRTAALLDQERTNIFTQSVANIPPGGKVKVVISYLEQLPYQAGTYSFVFPMVVGPRYIPGNPVGRQAGGWADDTDRVPDASRITPKVALPGTRAGHDISVEVKLDAGLPLDSIYSSSHDVDVVRNGDRAAVVRLRSETTIPNKDFVLKYDVAGRTIQDALLAHKDKDGGYFTLILQPPDRPRAAEVTPKEIIFVLDTSGSMSGFPIEKAKESMRYALDRLNPNDTFNLITFSGDTEILFPEPVAATAANLATAKRFLESRQGGGGTEMMKAIRAALDTSDTLGHVRIACFMTDGYVGNEEEIVAEVRRHPNARVFAFGIGTAVNRYLLDKMSEYGRGEVEYVSLNDDGSAAAKRFYERVRNPLLTDIRIDWGNLPVTDLYPAPVPDLFASKPVAISGRFSAEAHGTLRLTGQLGGRPFSREIRVDLPQAETRYPVLAQLWARAKVDHLIHTGPDDARAEITKLGLAYHLMTPFTSFVAVDERIVNEGGKARRVETPVEMPEGVSYEGVFGEQRMMAVSGLGVVGGVFASGHPKLARLPAAMPAPPARAAVRVDAALQADTASKIHPALASRTGRVAVQVWVNNRSEESIAALKRAGLEVTKLDPSNSKLVIGRIDISKLEAIAKLAFVTYIRPQE